MRSSWSGKEVLGMLERNYRTWCALNGVAIDDTALEEDDTMDVDMEAEEEWDGIADEDEEIDDTPSFFKEEADRLAKEKSHKTPSKRKKTRVNALIQAKIARVLDKTGLADARSGKCDENDFLRLLLAFNEEGIHFA